METSAGSILGGAFRLVRERPLAVGIWCLIYIAATVASGMFISPAMQPAFSPGASPAATFADLRGIFAGMAMFGLGMMLLYTFLYAAAQRAVLRPREDAFAYLRIGMDELRLFLLSIILSIGLVAVSLVLLIPFAVLIGMMGAGLGLLAVIPLILLAYLFFLGALAWLTVRFSLAFPLTLLRGRIVIAESWTLTKGRFWSLFGAYFALFVVFFCIGTIIGLVTTGGYWSEIMQGDFTPEAVEAAGKRQMARQLSPDLATIFGWIANGLAGGFAIALFGGALATAARDLTGDVEGVAETFA